jgi:serine/threonine protein kinase HipA of HipAB toxin-antitoxin module
MLFSGFIGIMIFDALVGETDRHEENWGILKYQDYYQISPLYDNG